MNIKKNYLLGWLLLGTNPNIWSMQKTDNTKQGASCQTSSCNSKITQVDLKAQLNNLTKILQQREDNKDNNNMHQIRNIMSFAEDEFILANDDGKRQWDQIQGNNRELSQDFKNIIEDQKMLDYDKKKIQETEKKAKNLEDQANQAIIKLIQSSANEYANTCQSNDHCISNNGSDLSGQESDRSNNYYETLKQQQNINNFFVFDIKDIGSITQYKDSINKKFIEMIDGNFNVAIFPHDIIPEKNNYETSIDAFFTNFLLTKKQQKTEFKIITFNSSIKKPQENIYHMSEMKGQWRFYANEKQKIPKFSNELKKSLEDQGIYALLSSKIMEITLAEIFQKALTDFIKSNDDMKINFNFIHYYTDGDTQKIIKTIKDHIKDPQGCLGKPNQEECLRYQIKQKFSKVQIRNTQNFVLNNLTETPKLEEIKATSCFYQESKEIDIAIQVKHLS